MTSWPTMLLLGATGRNLGKTTLACRLIRETAAGGAVVALKVTVIRDERAGCPRGGAGCGVCGALDGEFQLTEETRPGADKDTRRMLAAGARRVWWLRVRREALAAGIEALRACIEPNTPVVCESNSLRLACRPGLFVMIRDGHGGQVKATAGAVLSLADLLLSSDGTRHVPDPGQLTFLHGRWTWHQPASSRLVTAAFPLPTC